ncbi:MAG: HAD-IC family P-type ATPase, partial [archaeon]|nr:HAD-IC family P-type ATPase [archaeon]
AITKMFIQDTNILILVYSIDNKRSFESLDYWYKTTVDICGKGLILGVAGNKSDLFEQEEVSDEEGKKILLGDMNEKALYNYLEKNDYDLIIPKTKEKPIETLPFKSEYKYRMNLYENGDNYILYVKGDQQRVSQFFTKFLVEDREEEYSEHENDLLDQCAAYAQDSMRTVVCGQKIVTKEEFDTLNKKYYFEKELGFFREMANGLTFTFMVGIRDNYREDVPDAILNCHKAGITVRMVTGDNINSSIAISKDTHIISPEQAEEALTLAKDYKKLLYKNEEKLDDLLRDVKDARSPIAIEGEVFRKVCGGITKIDKGNGEMDIFLVDEEAFAHVTKRLRIIARASPEDKFLLVFGLKELGNIIAVTGEDKGDVPAVKQAHVGFVMGIRGIDKTKEAADILLLNDNFSSIVRAYEFGRNIHDCIKKFIQFQLTTYIVLIFMIFLGSLLLKDSPLNTIQLLWINLIMNSFASLLLTTEDPTDKLFARKPYSRDGSFLTTMIKTHIISQSIFQIIILTVILFFGDIVFGVPSDRELEHFMWNNVNGYHFTIFFNIFVYLQVFNLFNSRKLLKDEYNVFDGIESNLNYYLIQIIIIFVIQWILVSFGGSVVRTKYLTISQHLLCLGISALSLLWDFIVKRLPINIEDDSVVHDEEENFKIKEGEDALL